MSRKHENIIKGFISEIGVIEHEFLRFRRNPPLTRNQPPHIGAIRWQKLLIEHLKKSILVFEKLENDPAMQRSYLKRSAYAQYISLFAEMNEYEKQQYDNFLANGSLIVNNILKRNILKLSIYGQSESKYFA